MFVKRILSVAFYQEIKIGCTKWVFLTQVKHFGYQRFLPPNDKTVIIMRIDENFLMIKQHKYMHLEN